MNEIEFSQFEQIEIRTGTIVSVEDFPKARKPAFKLTIDFGELGVRRSSAQITEKYSKENLVGMQVVAITNLPPRQIADFRSEVLVLGVESETGIVLLTTDHHMQNGKRIS